PYGYEPESDDGAGVSYTYDSRGNRLRTTNALGEVVQELSYNLRNQPVIQEDTFGNRTELSYELDGKIKDIRRSGNHQRTLQQYEYNARGQITGVVDGNQNPISYDVDSWGRITGIGFVDGGKEGYEYTPAGQVSRTIDGNGNAVQYRYNSLGKVSERIDQLGDTETFRYDEEGNLSLHIDRDGRQLQRACNVFGQPVYEKASDAEGKHTNISTWHYDSLGRVTRAVCVGKSYDYIYDAYGNLKEKRSNGKRLVSYTHDRAGQITEIRDPTGVSTRYEYDILGRRSRIFNDDGLEVRYGYDALNRIRHIRYGNGVETACTYDGDGNIRTLETRAGENVLLSFAYRYDGNGNRTAKAGTQAALGGITSEITAGNNALDLSYAYDVRGQLLEERRNGASVCYAYDKAGNRIRKTDAQGEIRYLYNEKNQLVEEESPADRKQFSYDRQGGIIEEKNAAGTRRFSYNSRHQQTRVETETGSVQENRYDAEGLRFELLENGRRTSFVYHNGELLQEEGREEQGTSYHLGAGMEAFRRGQELSYYHRDEQLSTALVTDGQGEIRNSYQYDAFGMSLGTTEKLNNRIRYTGQQYDDVTGQYYLRARYYNPVAGRFMQEDVYQGDGLNLYAYCGNNPVVYYDPSGYYTALGNLFTDSVIETKGNSTDLKIAILKMITGDADISDATVGSHQAQHLIPNEFRNNIAVSVSGYQVDHALNGILDINRNSSTPGALDNFLRNYNVSAENMEFYISNKTQHGWAPGTSFYHGAYNEYVGSRLAQLDEKYQLSLMLETKTLPEIREQLRLSGQLEMLQADITGLNNELRRANQEGIDLYLTHPNNTNIIDYTEGGTLSHEDAMKKYREENFGEKENKESLKSNGCGNGKKV
ncbi:RHS repeat domain-containing protein, partial [Waltera sp.]|uniref:RHS repeat domain-containing protein n=1 Tax=Waltera sp. TaxID=2815806 RepID=UPI003AB96025